MKEYVPYILVVISTIIFTIFLIDSERQIEHLEKELQTQTDSLNNCIDSLIHEIDTLEWENTIWDFNIRFSTTHLLSAIIKVESSDDDSAYNASEDAVGCLQIRKTMVDDVNRILKRQKSTQRFHYEDRWCRHKSVQMFDVYCKHYNLNSAEQIARCWNGGPRGNDNPNTLNYWAKVEKEIEENYALR